MPLQSKSEAATLVALGAHETFTHETEASFDITEIWTAIAAKTIPFQYVEFPLDADFANLIWKTREIDLERVVELSEKQAAFPILVLSTSTNEHIIADGSHRIIRNFLDGKTAQRAVLIPIELAIRPNMAGMVELAWGQGDAIFKDKAQFRNK